MKPFVGTPTDYSKPERWLACPNNPNKTVDLLYLYPSSCENPKADTICAVDEPTMVLVAKRNFAQQATAFEPVANIFAPYWRQVNGTKLSQMSFEEVDAAEWAEPRTDVYAALDYYFEHLNQGRPYFLAGHSQGSRLSYMAISEYMREHPDRYANMICAYCLGDSLTKRYLEENPHVRAAQAADDLGVVVSWNTEGPANKGHGGAGQQGARFPRGRTWGDFHQPAELALRRHPSERGVQPRVLHALAAAAQAEETARQRRRDDRPGARNRCGRKSQARAMRDYGDSGDEETRVGFRSGELPRVRLLVLLPEHPRKRPRPRRGLA